MIQDIATVLFYNNKCVVCDNGDTGYPFLFMLGNRKRSKDFKTHTVYRSCNLKSRLS